MLLLLLSLIFLIFCSRKWLCLQIWFILNQLENNNILRRGGKLWKVKIKITFSSKLLTRFCFNFFFHFFFLILTISIWRLYELIRFHYFFFNLFSFHFEFFSFRQFNLRKKRISCTTIFFFSIDGFCCRNHHRRIQCKRKSYPDCERNIFLLMKKMQNH